MSDHNAIRQRMELAGFTATQIEAVLGKVDVPKPKAQKPQAKTSGPIAAVDKVKSYRERAMRAVELRNGGLRWSEIAERLSFNCATDAKYNARRMSFSGKIPMLETVGAAVPEADLAEAYRLLQRGASNYALSATVDAPTGEEAVDLLRQYANGANLPWPVDSVAWRKGVYHRKLREKLTWKQVAAKVGHDWRLLSRAVRDVLPKPKSASTPQPAKDRTGERAYTLYTKGNGWAEIAHSLNSTRARVRNAALDYAKAENRELVEAVSRGAPKETLYENAYQMRRAGYTWTGIAKHYGLTLNGVALRARRHCEANNIPWPIKPGEKA